MQKKKAKLIRAADLRRKIKQQEKEALAANLAAELISPTFNRGALNGGAAAETSAVLKPKSKPAIVKSTSFDRQAWIKGNVKKDPQ